MVLTKEEIHNVWLYTEGLSKGIMETGGESDFPVLFTENILELVALKDYNESLSKQVS